MRARKLIALTMCILMIAGLISACGTKPKEIIVKADGIPQIYIQREKIEGGEGQAENIFTADSFTIPEETQNKYPNLCSALKKVMTESYENQEDLYERVVAALKNSPDNKQISVDDKLIIQRDDETIFSYTEEISGSTGGNHGFYEASSKNFSTGTGKEIKLDDIVSDRAAFVDLVYKGLADGYEGLADDDNMMWRDFWQRVERADKLDDVFDFVITNDGVLLIFENYVLGPWSAGSQQLDIPFAGNRKIFKNSKELESIETGKIRMENCAHSFDMNKDGIDDIISVMPGKLGCMVSIYSGEKGGFFNGPLGEKNYPRYKGVVHDGITFKKMVHAGERKFLLLEGIKEDGSTVTGVIELGVNGPAGFTETCNINVRDSKGKKGEIAGGETELFEIITRVSQLPEETLELFKEKAEETAPLEVTEKYRSNRDSKPEGENKKNKEDKESKPVEAGENGKPTNKIVGTVRVATGDSVAKMQGFDKAPKDGEEYVYYIELDKPEVLRGVNMTFETELFRLKDMFVDDEDPKEMNKWFAFGEEYYGRRVEIELNEDEVFRTDDTTLPISCPGTGLSCSEIKERIKAVK